jgi:hypothetical protein
MMTLLYPTNFTVSIDGSTPTQSFFGEPPAAVYSFTAYDQQSLQFGPHNLDLMLLDYFGIQADNSNFLFDDAIINETNPFPGAPTSSTSVLASTETSPSLGAPTSSPTIPASAHHSTKVGAIAGGVIGGIAALACLCCLVVFYRRQASSRYARQFAVATPVNEWHTAPSAGVFTTFDPLSDLAASSNGCAEAPLQARNVKERQALAHFGGPALRGMGLATQVEELNNGPQNYQHGPGPVQPQFNVPPGGFGPTWPSGPQGGFLSVPQQAQAGPSQVVSSGEVLVHQDAGRLRTQGGGADEHRVVVPPEEIPPTYDSLRR